MTRSENIKKYYSKKYIKDVIVPKSREDVRLKVFQRNFSRHPNFTGTFEEFINHFEQLFKGTDYSWDNSDKWHIDHITPLCAGGKHEVKNTRPLNAGLTPSSSLRSL